MILWKKRVFKNFDKITKNLKSKFFFDYNISNSTWFRTGGRVDLFCIVLDEHELKIILNNLKDEIPIFVIGMGSNVLIRDGGFRGLIIKLGKSFNTLNIKNNILVAGASILDSNLSKYAYYYSLQGLEFFSGIPGSVGGAVKMNAGCYGCETKDVLQEVSIISKEGIKKTLTNKDLGLSYRYSKLTDNDIVTSVKFKGELGEKKEIGLKIKEIKLMRETSQPLRNKTGGSTFKNPIGQFAASLIEQADCKGMILGGAAVSTKHSNFLINLDNATAKDIENLGKKVQERVMEKLNVLLEWEIKIIGDNYV